MGTELQEDWGRRDTAKGRGSVGEVGEGQTDGQAAVEGDQAEEGWPSLVRRDTVELRQEHGQPLPPEG